MAAMGSKPLVGGGRDREVSSLFMNQPSVGKVPMANTVRPLRVYPVHTGYPRLTRPQRTTHQGLRALARNLIASVPASERSEHSQLMRDFASRDAYGKTVVDTLDAFFDVCAKSSVLSHRNGLETLCREQVARRAPSLSLVRADVFDAEDESNSAFDKALRRYEATPTVSNWEAALEAAYEQIHTTQQAATLLAANPPKGAA